MPIKATNTPVAPTEKTLTEKKNAGSAARSSNIITINLEGVNASSGAAAGKNEAAPQLPVSFL